MQYHLLGGTALGKHAKPLAYDRLVNSKIGHLCLTALPWQQRERADSGNGVEVLLEAVSRQGRHGGGWYWVRELGGIGRLGRP